MAKPTKKLQGKATAKSAAKAKPKGKAKAAPKASSSKPEAEKSSKDPKDRKTMKRGNKKAGWLRDVTGMMLGLAGYRYRMPTSHVASGAKKAERPSLKPKTKKWEVTKAREVWGQYSESGEPLGSVCRVDKETSEEGWPGLPVENAAELWHSKEDKTLAFRTEYATARRIKKDAGILKRRFSPSSSVKTSKLRFKMVYHDVGFLTDAEFLSVVGSAQTSFKNLKTHKGQEQVTDRGESVQGVYVSLRDLPEGLLGWIRKVRTGYLTQVQQDDTRLSPEHQIRGSQGQVLFDHFSEILLNSSESASRSKHRPSLPMIPALINQLASQKEEKKAEEEAKKKEEAGGAGTGGAEGEEGEEEENFVPDPVLEDDVEEVPKDERSVTASQLALRPDLLAGAASSSAFEQPPVKSRQTSSKAGKSRKSAVLEDATAAEDDACEIDQADAPKWMKEDSILSQVIKKLGKVYKCFHHLSPSSAFEQRLALGHQLRGAKKVADTMKGNRLSQHSLLTSRIELMEHVDNLINPANAISKMTPPILRGSLMKLQEEDIALPYDLRLQAAERFTMAVLDEMSESATHEDKPFQKGLPKWMRLCAVWEASRTKDGGTQAGHESDPTFGWILQSMQDEIGVSLKLKQLSAQEAENKKKENHEALAEYLIDCLASEQFLSMLQTPSTPNRKKMLLMSEAYLKAFADAKAEKLVYEMLPAEICAVLDRFAAMCSAFISLNHPRPGHAGSNAKDLLDLVTNASSHAAEKRMRKAFSEQGSVWQKLYDELLSKGQSTTALLPVLDELTEKLSNFKVDDKQQNVIASVDAELLERCVEHRPQFEKDMRNGLLQSFDLQLCRVALLVAKAVPAHSAEDLASINPKFNVDVAIAALDACLEAPGVAEAKKSLQGWHKRERSSLQLLDLLKVLHYYPETLAAEIPEDLHFAHHGKILFESILAVGTEMLSKNDKARRACGVAFAVLFESLLQAQVPSNEWNADAKAVLTLGIKAVHHLQHPCADKVEAVARIILAGCDFLDQVGVLKQMGDSPESRVAADANATVMTSMLVQASRVASMLADGTETEALVPSNPGQEDVTALVSLNADSTIRQILQDEDFMACLKVTVDSMTQSVREAQDKATTAVKGFQNGGERYWKAQLAATAEISEVLAAASKSIDDIDGEQADEAIDGLKQVLSKCEDFIGKATFYGSVMPQMTGFKAFVDGVRVIAKRCKALSCESLLAFAHSSCKSIEWQARLIRHQLTEIMIGNIDEADLHPVLLQSARSLVESAGKQARDEKEGKNKAPPAATSEEAGAASRKKLRLG
ncbi:unnamed protein product [Symbiodinium sp. CCMP2592]|nr:unnamed protein product [Symbiodinium sp. CCMP2592]